MNPAERFRWRTAFKIAWREARASSARFAFVVLAVAVGVGSLTGVRGFSRSFRDMLLRNARVLMAADMTVRVFGLPSPEQQAVLTALEKRGVRRTWITETLTMASSDAVKEPLLVSLKAVDPKVYPFYGIVQLDPPIRLSVALNSHSVVVSDDLLIRLKTAVGENLRLGGQDFRIAAVLVSEPDRMTGTLNVGPRVMMTREGLNRTGLISLGSRASERFLFRLPAGGPGVSEVRGILKRAFPESTIADYRQTHPIITRGLNRSTTFLSLVSLIALIVGALGVGTAMHAHLQQRMDTIAIMKCLGARSGEVLRIYVIQTVLLGLTGGLLGVLLGTLVERAFPYLIAHYFQLQPAWSWDPASAGQGLLVGVLTALLFTLPPLLEVRGVRPGSIFRREMAEVRPPWRERLRRSRPSLAAGMLILLGIGLIAAWLVESGWRDSLRLGLYFVGGLVVSLLVLAGIAWLLLRAVRAFLRRSPRRLPATMRHGIANLYRPGNHAEAVLVALGIGVMFTLTVYLLQHSLVNEIMSSAPPGMPNVFLLDIPAQQRDAFVDLLKGQPGIVSPPTVFGSVALKLVNIDGKPVQRLPLQHWGRRFLRTRPVTWMNAKPKDMEIVQGHWWDKAQTEPQVCVEQEAAGILGIKAGSALDWSGIGNSLHSRVACVFRAESVRVSSRFEFVFNPGSLKGFPAIYYGSMRVRPRDVPSLQRVAYEQYPTVTVVNVADVLQIVQQVVDQIAMVIRFISAFAILAGIIILASSVAGTRFRRVREVVILKTLGATRRKVAGIFSVEFLVLGAVAGVMGSLLASGFAALILKRLLDAEFHFSLLPNVIAIVATAAVANVAGWVASCRILGQKPLEVLREE